MSRLVPAKRPREPCSIGTPIDCYANFFVFKVIGTEEIIKFAVTFDPDVPVSEDHLRAKLLRKAASGLKAYIGRYVYANTAIYAIRKTADTGPITVSLVFDNVTYTITLTSVSAIRGNSTELRNFYCKFFNCIQGNLDLVMIGRKFFNFMQPLTMNAQFGITLYPGFATSVLPLEGGFMVNIDVTHRCMHTQTVYDEMRSVLQRRVSNVQAELDRLLLDRIVVTCYKGNKIYRVLAVELSMTPHSTFQMKENVVTFEEYYKKQYNRQLKFLDQPLLKCKNKRWECYLVPELCYLTGLTDEQKSDINLRREMIRVTQKCPRDRLSKCRDLIVDMKRNEKTRNIMRDWGVEVMENPVPLTARVLPGGAIALKGYQFSLTESANLDRELQREVYAHNPLEKWAVVYQREEQQTVQRFMEELRKAIETYKVRCNAPELFALDNGHNFQAWDQFVRSTIRPGVTALICVLPGSKGKSKIYDDLKRLLFSTFPVPSQCVLTATLKKDRGLRSVANKIVTQIIAKTGGVPWTFAQLPFMDGRSMVIGIDTFDKKGVDKVTGFCATTDREFSRYVSFPLIGAYSAGANVYEEVITTTFNAFQQSNSRTFPNKIFILRDGLSDGEKTAFFEQDVQLLLSSLRAFSSRNNISEPVRVMVIVVNKRVQARFFQKLSSDLGNPAPGTVVDTMVVGADRNEFFLIPTKSNQGVITPTHFQILYDDMGVNLDDVKVLVYRMCYLYYNWSGAIRVPAPCQYAHKLAFAMGERAVGEHPPQPHDHWKQTRSLYFL